VGAVKPAFTAQVSHVDIHAVIDTSGKRPRQLIDPSLPDGVPLTARGSSQKILATSAGSVDAVLDAQENAAPDQCNLGRNRAPERMVSHFEALMPDGPNAARFSRGEKYHFVFADRIARCGTARRVLRRE
jgi:hypothetical protein